MTRRKWFDILFSIYQDCRDLPFWAEVYEQHDQEDRDYFMKLDALNGR